MLILFYELTDIDIESIKWEAYEPYKPRPNFKSFFTTIQKAFLVYYVTKTF